MKSRSRTAEGQKRLPSGDPYLVKRGALSGRILASPRQHLRLGFSAGGIWRVDWFMYVKGWDWRCMHEARLEPRRGWRGSQVMRGEICRSFAVMWF
jgi:hypothetical protein